MPGYSITLSGLLVVIFFSVFVPTQSSTLIAGIGSSVIVCGFYWWNKWLPASLKLPGRIYFLLVLITFFYADCPLHQKPVAAHAV
jgi:hypothetical protein